MNNFSILGFSLFGILVLFCFAVIYSRFTFTLDFSDSFTATPQPAPKLSIKLNGVSGDSAIVGFDGFEEPRSAEELIITPGALEKLKNHLDGSALERWEFFSKLPTSIFKFKAWIVSDTNSPNNAKKASYFLVTIGSSDPEKILPGSKIPLTGNFGIQDLLLAIPTIKTELYYNGFFNNFYSAEGDFVSQATGKLVIKPSSFTIFIILLGSWLLALSFVGLVKQTIITSGDLDPVAKFLFGVGK